MNVKGEAMYSAAGLIKETGMLSYPVEQSFRSDSRDLITSLYVTFCSLTLSWLLVSNLCEIIYRYRLLHFARLVFQPFC